MAENQRCSPRIVLDVRVNYDFNAIAHSKDISEGGICLITEQSVEEQKMLNLVFQLPARFRPIESVGKVMWCRKAIEYLFEIGVSFWDIKDAEQLEIQEYLDSFGAG
ncbi:MAG: PilZ domain-containing protein [Spirochaetales bacterium]|jgi:hypothetical protein|nr:PilZ domain-containing protein [Spirochaetales bacterium]